MTRLGVVVARRGVVVARRGDGGGGRPRAGEAQLGLLHYIT